jgi:hypothetical protein
MDKRIERNEIAMLGNYTLLASLTLKKQLKTVVVTPEPELGTVGNWSAVINVERDGIQVETADFVLPRFSVGERIDLQLTSRTLSKTVG